MHSVPLKLGQLTLSALRSKQQPGLFRVRARRFDKGAGSSSLARIVLDEIADQHVRVDGFHGLARKRLRTAAFMAVTDTAFIPLRCKMPFNSRT